jgi:hypothetical protein
MTASGDLEELYITAGNSWHAADLTALTGAPPGALNVTGYDSAQFHAKQYAYVAANGDLEELYFVAGSTWQAADLSSLA